MYTMTTTLASMSGCLSASQCTCCALVPNACPPAPTSIARFLTRSLSSLCLSRSLALARALSGSLADQEGSVWPRRTWPCHCPLSTVTSSHACHIITHMSHHHLSRSSVNSHIITHMSHHHTHVTSSHTCHIITHMSHHHLSRSSVNRSRKWWKR